MSKSFNLEDFKNGKKALTRDGRVATFVGICDECSDDYKLLAIIAGHNSVSSYFLSGNVYENRKLDSDSDLVSMVSRHQALIDSYDPEDTWQYKIQTYESWFDMPDEPHFEEGRDYRLHPHNDLIKSWKKGAKIEAYIVGDWVEEPNPDWYEDTQYRIKPEQKTKTVYEWLYKIEADRYQLHPYLMDEEEAKVNFGKYAHKKTGRSWEVEV